MSPSAAGLALLLLAGCGQQDADAPVEQAEAAPGIASYESGARDRLCLQRSDGGSAGFITYAEKGDANCTVRGRFDPAQRAIVPEGDQACRISLVMEGNQVRLGEITPACAYYCGPNASFSNRTFTSSDAAQPVTDFAGDPLC